MLSLLLDENISHKVAEQVKINRRDASIQSISLWRNGSLMSATDETILQAAAEDRLTLITYDQKTIMPLLRRWAGLNLDHYGVVFISHRAIRSDDIGALTRAILRFWDEERTKDWRNQSGYLRP